MRPTNANSPTSATKHATAEADPSFQPPHSPFQTANPQRNESLNSVYPLPHELTNLAPTGSYSSSPSTGAHPHRPSTPATPQSSRGTPKHPANPPPSRTDPPARASTPPPPRHSPQHATPPLALPSHDRAHAAAACRDEPA